MRGSTYQVDQPSENDGRAVAHRQEREAGENHRDGEAHDRDSLLRAVTEDLRCATFQGKAV